MCDFTDLLYEASEGIARITINRPEKYNAFRGQTCEELITAFNRAGWDRSVGVIVLTGAGDKAFCTGGDQSAHDGGYDGRGLIGLPVEELQTVIRDVPKPVIARVNGYAVGGGNVLVTCCDLAIASETAQFGQVGPKVGSVDPGFGTALLARTVGEKKAREIWYLCRRYKAQEALEMGLVNRVGAGRRARRRGRALVRGDPRHEPHRHRHRQALVQRRQRIHPRHQRARHADARPLLRDRRIQGRRRRLHAEAQAALPEHGRLIRPTVVAGALRPALCHASSGRPRHRAGVFQYVHILTDYRCGAHLMEQHAQR